MGNSNNTNMELQDFIRILPINYDIIISMNSLRLKTTRDDILNIIRPNYEIKTVCFDFDKDERTIYIELI